MAQKMIAAFDGQAGSLTWELPPVAVTALQGASPAIQRQMLDAFGSNLELFCGALLQAFGNPVKVEVLNMMMRELQELVDKK